MIRLRNVTVAYGDRVILDNINLDIHQGETLAILGASGSGKSTILRLIIGLQKPTKGHIFFHDADITGYDEEQLTAVRRHMGMVFQYSALFDSMTVGENVAFGLRQHTKDDEATIQRIVEEKLRLVGLEGIEDMMPNDLSGGMKKRVSLARAIALDPQVILYDEPTAGLDPLRCMDINRLVVSMQKQIHATSASPTTWTPLFMWLTAWLIYKTGASSSLPIRRPLPIQMMRKCSALSTAGVFQKKEGIAYEVECRSKSGIGHYCRRPLIYLCRPDPGSCRNLW